MNDMSLFKYPRAFGIILTGVVMCGAPAALVLSCAGLFFGPVCSDLGFSKSSFALYQTALYLTVTCFVPFASRLFAKIDARICTTAAVLAMGGGLMLMSCATQLWHFIALGVLLGLGNTFVMFVSIPALVDRWFARHVGLFTGICFAFTGVGGAIFSPIGSLVITHYGWRAGYFVFGCIACALALPFTTCVVRSHPRDLGLSKAYASSHDTKDHPNQAIAQLDRDDSPTLSRATRSGAFLLVAAFAALANGVNVSSQYLPAFLDGIMPMQHGLLVGSVVISALSAGQAIGKISLGHISDYSIKGGLLFGCLSGACAFAVICSAPHPFMVVVSSGLFFGFFYANGLVYLPLLTRRVFGSELYAPIYARISVVSTLVMAFGVPAWGALSSYLGFNGIFACAAVLCVLTLVVGWLSVNYGQRRTLENQAT